MNYRLYRRRIPSGPILGIQTELKSIEMDRGN